MATTKKRQFLETTSVPASKSMAEIFELLREAGAVQIVQHIEGGRIVGLDFALNIGQRAPMAFRMPVRTGAVYNRLVDNLGPRSRQTADDLFAQAERIAWRQLSAWLRAQLALVDVGMAEPAEVLMPYALGDGGKTMWETFSRLQIAAPAKEGA